MAVPTSRRYLQWKEDLIKIILADDRANSVIKVNEINCVINGDVDISYLDGDTPEEAWEGEVQAMYDSH